MVRIKKILHNMLTISPDYFFRASGLQLVYKNFIHAEKNCKIVDILCVIVGKKALSNDLLEKLLLFFFSNIRIPCICIIMHVTIWQSTNNLRIFHFFFVIIFLHTHVRGWQKFSSRIFRSWTRRVWARIPWAQNKTLKGERFRMKSHTKHKNLQITTEYTVFPKFWVWPHMEVHL